MRILLLSQYYHPEPVEKVHDLARGLARLGHQVQVITGFPCYPKGRIYTGYLQSLSFEEQIEGVNVTRLPQWPDHSRSAIRRAIYYLSFMLSASIIGLFKARRADVMLVYQAALPVGLAGWFLSHARRLPYAVDVVDLWPESVVVSGMLRNRVAIWIIRQVARLIYHGAERVNAVTPGFRRHLLAMGVPEGKTSVINNWMPSDTYQPTPPDAALASREEMAGKFNVLYAGSMGPFQGLRTVIEAAALLQDVPAIQLVLVGDGLEFDELVELASAKGLENVRFLGRRPPEQMPGLFALADVLLVHLKPDPLSDVSIPSKTFSYMATGRPVLMAVKGDAAAFVEENGLGVTTEPSNPLSLASAIKRLHALPASGREQIGRKALEAYQGKYCSAVQVKKIEALLEQTVKCSRYAGRSPAGAVA